MEHNMEALRERFSNLLDALMHDFNLEKYIYEGSPEDIDCSWDEQQDAADHYGIWACLSKQPSSCWLHSG